MEPKNNSWKRPLAAPRGIGRLVSAILEAKRLPKWSPRGLKIESKRRSKLKTRLLQKPLFFFQWILMIFEVPSSFLGAQNRCKMASDRSLRAWWLLKAYFLALGALLEALGAEKHCLERSWPAQEPKRGPKLEPKWGPKTLQAQRLYL